MVPARTKWAGGRALWLLAAAGAIAVVLVASIVVWITRSTGTIRLDLDGPRDGVQVQVDGEFVENGATEPLRLRPGQHLLLVTGENVQPVSTSFTVARGDNPVLRVRLVPRTDDQADPIRRRSSRGSGRGHDDDDDDREKRSTGVPRRHDDDDRDDR
jgi:hypothetical protein